MTADKIRILCGFVYAIVAIVNAAPSSKLPKGFIQCKLSYKLEECLKNAIELAIPHLANGVPSLGIIKIDPLRISTLQIDQGNGPVSIKLNFKDLNIHNIKYVKIHKVSYDPLAYNLFMDMDNPKTVIIEGDYEISGKVLVLPIVGKGKCKISIDLSKIIVNVQMKPIVKNEVTYLEIDKLSWKFTATKLDLKFDNLFNGDKALGNNMNIFLNENWRDLLVELQPAIEDIFGVAFTEIAHQFLSRIPLNQIYLD